MQREGLPDVERRLGPRRALRGRRSECEVLGGLVDGVRGGHGAVVMVHGEAGVGETALLDYGAESAADLTVVRALGVESEMELVFAGLHQLSHRCSIASTVCQTRSPRRSRRRSA